MRYNIGDVVINPYASKENPHRVSIYISTVKNYIKCLCKDGKIVNYSKDIDFKVCGHIPIFGIIKEVEDGKNI